MLVCDVRKRLDSSGLVAKRLFPIIISMSFQQKTLSALWGKKAKSARTVPEEPAESEPESAESLAATDSVAVESESDDDVSPPVTPDAPARKRVCLPVAAASQTSVRKPNLDISDIGSVFQSEHQRWAVCPDLATSRSKQRSKLSITAGPL